MALTNPFENISIETSDVVEYYPALTDHLEASETDVTHEINQALCQLWDDLKDQFRDVYEDSKIKELRDFEASKPIERKICYQVIANVLLNHGSPEQGAIFQEKANTINITDIAFSEDSTVSDDEKLGVGLKSVQFGR